MKNHKVVKFGNSGHITLSKNLVGKYVKVITVDDEIIGLGEVQRINFKLENLQSEIDLVKSNNRIRDREEIIERKKGRMKLLKKILIDSEKASDEAEK